MLENVQRNTLLQQLYLFGPHLEVEIVKISPIQHRQQLSFEADQWVMKVRHDLFSEQG